MAERFANNGISFLYPENWRLEREENETGWSVLLQSPDTAFFLLSLDEDGPDSEHVANTALEALREDYDDLEAEERVDSLAGQPAVGHDIRFFSLDLTNTCCTRSFYAGAGTVLAMWQANDLELDEVEPVFNAIRASLRVEE